ncbi:alcohol dehydrogenase catalytic domain-containing protein [Candidatus Woesearchaeota archaeon]|nr:alcohol dehydrogenase catalytic domain-containing protein [Candidatus Woesearchaeota archaeon]
MSETMLAIGLKRNAKGIQEAQIPIPKITKPTEALIKIKETGICGTDFNMIKYDSKDIAEGEDFITLGHEVIGTVEKIGSEVKTLKEGDLVTATVRRSCGICNPCLHSQSDMCMTGLFKERGIHKLHGFLTKYVVDEEEYVVKVPKELEKYGVFIEPLSIAEKGIEQIKIIQSRMPWSCAHPKHRFEEEEWGHCKTALVIGAGPIGFLATCLLRLGGVNTYVVEIVDEASLKIQLAKELGAQYIDARNKKPEDIVNLCCNVGTLDIIFEASGASDLAISLIPYMSRSSIYVMTGIPKGEKHTIFDAHAILRQIVRHNQVIVGSVNSNRNHFVMAINDIKRINKKFNNILDEAITHRFTLSQYKEIFDLKEKDRIKIVVGID